jgi:hypothetical protein
MRFWDASAIVPLLTSESTTAALLSLIEEDPSMLVWWASEVECASAIARLERDTRTRARGRDPGIRAAPTPGQQLA